METRLDRSEVAVYVGAGLFAIAVFAVAVWLVGRSSAVALGGRQLAGLGIGFTLFMCSYFVAWFLWDWLHGDSQQ